MDSHNILPFLGLALRGGNLAVGEEVVETAVRARDARLLLLAGDAPENTRRRVEHFAELGQCLWLRLPFAKEELGHVLGRTSVAVAAVTDMGFAHALARKLADLDPARYGEAAGRLELKARRRVERQQARKTQRREPKRPPERRGAEPPGPVRRTPEPDRREAAGDARGRQSAGERPRRTARDAPSRWEKRPGGGRPNPYARSRPVKKGKGSFRKREDGRS